MRNTNRIIVTAACTALWLASSLAPAQPQLASLSVAVPPDEIAESIIIFVPAVDTPGVTGAEPVYLQGRIVEVERGERPGAIVMNPHTLWGVRPAGIPMRMYLVRHPDKDAYYPIYGTALQDADLAATAAPVAKTELAVRVTSPLGDVAHAADLDGVPYSFGAGIRVAAGGSPTFADLYLGVMPAGGTESYSWVQPTGHPYLGKGMKPLLTNLALEGEAVLDTKTLTGKELKHTFTGAEAPGMYLVFATLVRAGTDPGNTANWLAVDMKPLLVD